MIDSGADVTIKDVDLRSCVRVAVGRTSTMEVLLRVSNFSIILFNCYPLDLTLLNPAEFIRHFCFIPVRGMMGRILSVIPHDMYNVTVNESGT